MSSLNQIYRQGADLTLKNVHRNLYLLNLTSIHGRKYVSSVGLSKAIQAINDQVKYDFAPVWGPTCTLIDKTAAFNLQLNESLLKNIESETPESTLESLVSFIVRNSKDATIDWSKSGIIYLIDDHIDDYAGVHMDETVSRMDIPYAIVTVGNTSWPSVLSHEVLELLADPWGFRFMKQDKYPISRWKSQNWIIEVCDPCEDILYAAPNGVKVSDFIVPAYFTVATPATTPLDFKKKLFRNTVLQPTAEFPYPMLKNGYLTYFNSTGDQYGQITWWDGPKPVYEVLSDSSNSSHGSVSGRAAAAPHRHDNRQYRLQKYIENHKDRHNTAVNERRMRCMHCIDDDHR